jgi:N-acetylmuramoyl-L-alanine amidase
MRIAVVLLLAVALYCGGGRAMGKGAPAAGGSTGAAFFGTSYARLQDWSKENDFQVRWLKRDETVALTNRNASLVFEVDSRAAAINGVRVWLSHPVLLRYGSVYVSEVDLRTAVRPVLYPPRNPGAGRVETIVLDPGHGGNDPGNMDGFHQEKKYTLLLAEELSDQLQRAGFKVSLTRTRDVYVALSDRPDIARRRGADLFISLHWNSVSVGKAETRGAQTYCLSPAGVASSNEGGGSTGIGSEPGNANNERNMFLAYEIQRSLTRQVGMDDQGVRRARYQVLREARMPAVLIEGGYMSNPGESRRIYDAVYRRQMARAIVQGVLGYKARVEKGQ